jgi:hypothetical protein
MGCPFFVDSTRECLTRVKFLPADTFGFCATEKYKECPFYRTIKKEGPFCNRIAGCSVFVFFQSQDFEKFVTMTQQYCISTNNVNCKRYRLNKEGKPVPKELLPDGSGYRE